MSPYEQKTNILLSKTNILLSKTNILFSYTNLSLVVLYPIRCRSGQ